MILLYLAKNDHLEKVHTTLKRLNECKGQLNLDKCHIGGKEVAMLGHSVPLQGIKVDP